MRIACIGGLILDVKARSLAEARSGTSNPATVTRTAGGVAANIARTLGRLEAEVALFSIVGSDESGKLLRAVVSSDGVDAAGVESAGERTGTYLAVLDNDGSLVIGAADMAAWDRMDAAWVDRVAEAIAGFDLWVVDANLPAGSLAGLLSSRPAGVTALADPVSVAKAARLAGVLGGIDVVFPDEAEAAVLAGVARGEPAELAERILGRGVGTVVISLGDRGILVGDEGGCVVHPPMTPGRVVDVTGAGDALVAGYAYGLAAGRPPAATALAAASLTLESSGSVRSDLTPELLNSRMP